MEGQFVGYTFRRVGDIEPEWDLSGEPVEFWPEVTPDVPLHRYGQGPFCRFSIAEDREWQIGGVFVVTCDEAACFVGETVNLTRLWRFVGRITSSAVRQRGGQQTHCRINNLILGKVKREADVVLWLYSVENDAARRGLRSRLIAALNPCWNLR